MSMPGAGLCGASSTALRAVFVAHATALGSASGGVQLCTREYLRTIRAAGFSLSIAAVEYDRRLRIRIGRRLRPRPYAPRWRPELVDEIVASAREARAHFIFLNLVDLAPLAPLLRRRVAAACKIVLLSHGLESVEFLHAVQAQVRSNAGIRSAGRERTLGRYLFEEFDQRTHIDHVFCLTPVETEIERWLGAKSVSWMPRTIPERPPLDWSPAPGRLGFVGTMDHPPNRDGLVRFLEALEPLAPPTLEVRVVGGPPAAGAELAQRFRLVRYLGALSDEELDKEASTWVCFVHPLFYYARGCSMKLAVALSWQIPVVTTPAGCRGYRWREGSLPMADTPEALARLALRLADPGTAAVARKEVAAIARSAPTIDDVAALVRGALLSPDAIGGIGG
jgi:glycosyltransferase involved in cell wall biosynthesis